MKIFLIITFLAINLGIYAQDVSTSLLFKKGTELEYKTYAPKGGFFSKGDFFEITKLTFIVTDVKDSNNIKYSFITKIGTNPKDEKLSYQKSFVITSDGSKILIPIDFYSVDTIYFSNMYPKLLKDQGIYSSTIYNGKCLYSFPTDFDKSKFAFIGSRVMLNSKIRDYEMDFTQQTGSRGIRASGPENTGRIVENTFSIDMSINKFETKGKEKLTSGSGTYECYRIEFGTNSEVFGRGMNGNFILYYNTEVGFVKSESQTSKRRAGYMELVRVKR